MKKIILIISFICLANCCHSQSGWVQQNSGTTANLYSVKFINSQTGWCVGDSGKILKTTNGGISWIPSLPNYPANYRSITFTNSNIGYIIAYSGLMLKSTNMGLNWFDISFRNGVLNSLFFVNDSIGFVGGGYFV